MRTSFWDDMEPQVSDNEDLEESSETTNIEEDFIDMQESENEMSASAKRKHQLEQVYKSIYESHESEKGDDWDFGEYNAELEDPLDYEENSGNEKPNEIPKPQKRKKKSHVGRTIAIVASLVVLVTAGTVVGVICYNNTQREDSTISQEALEGKISRLYTTTNKDDIQEGIETKDLEEYYSLLDTVSGDTSNLQRELDTIRSFILDKKSVQILNSTEYDLTDDSMQGEIDSIRQHVDTYTVPGLAVTITDYLTTIQKDKDDFLELRQELMSIKDSSKFQEGNYQERIDAVTHINNKREVQEIFNALQAGKTAADIEEQLEKKKDEALQESLQKQLEEAQNAQAQISEEYDATKEELENQLQKAKEELAKQQQKQESSNQEQNSGTITTEPEAPEEGSSTVEEAVGSTVDKLLEQADEIISAQENTEG